MSKEGFCALCLKEKILRDSHIIPKFVGRWLKDNGTGYLVSAADGSKRVQDLEKFKLLCDDCEKKFSKLEGDFANKMFFPFHKDKVREFDYDENLKSFIMSMAWRCLQIVKEGYVKENPNSHLNTFVDKADKEWREFLNGDRGSIDMYETHLLFLDYVDTVKNTDLDNKFHWYLLHVTDFTICTSDKRVFFYVKLPWMVFVISIEPQKMEGWDGTIINKNGHISSGQTITDGNFGAFLKERAKLALYSSSGPSQEIADRRLTKVIEKDPKKFLESNVLQSMIVEKDLVRKKKMEKMPPSVIELVETAIITGKDDPNIPLADNQAHKMRSRRIADKIADLSEKDANQLHTMIYGVVSLAKILKENKQFTFTSDSLHITYMITFETSNESRVENLKKEFEKLKKQTQEKIHFAVFSYSPIEDFWQSGFFVPLETDSKSQEKKE